MNRFIKMNQISNALFKRVGDLNLHPQLHTDEEQSFQLHNTNVCKMNLIKMYYICHVSYTGVSCVASMPFTNLSNGLMG